MPGTTDSRPCILVAEDEPLISLILVEMLEDLELTVIGPSTSVPESLAILQDGHPIDAAILDLELQGSRSLPVADALAERGIPFAFVSGYGPETFATIGYDNVPLLPKPFDMRGLRTTLSQLLQDRVPIAEQTHFAD